MMLSGAFFLAESSMSTKAARMSGASDDHAPSTDSESVADGVPWAASRLRVEYRRVCGKMC